MAGKCPAFSSHFFRALRPDCLVDAGRVRELASTAAARGRWQELSRPANVLVGVFPEPCEGFRAGSIGGNLGT